MSRFLSVLFSLGFLMNASAWSCGAFEVDEEYMKEEVGAPYAPVDAEMLDLAEVFGFFTTSIYALWETLPSLIVSVDDD